MSETIDTDEADELEPVLARFVETRRGARANRVVASPDGAAAALRSDAVRTLVGRGLEFPLAFDEGGNLALSSGDDVATSVYMILMTAPGERVMRPAFGCDIWDHVFSPINTATLGQMAHAVRVALGRWEPRITVDDVRVRPDARGDDRMVGDDLVVLIEIDYRLRSSNDWRNLVFPFYVIPERESS